MTNSPSDSDHSTALIDALRAVRRKYDLLDRGTTAPIRRCRTADEVALEGAFWRIGGDIAHQQRAVASVVLHFPIVPHRDRANFSFGGYLHARIAKSASGTLRFRRLLDSRDRDELDHRLRGILRLAASDRSPVDWGVLGRDILWFFGEGGHVRRRWAQEFYAPRVDAGAPPTSMIPTPSPTHR